MFRCLALTLVVGTITLHAQPSLTLDQCLDKARANYPLVAQQDLLRRSAEYSVDNAYRGYLPSVVLTGQATYQSDVTEVPVRIPGFAPEPLSLDQYRIQAEITQTLWDGGTMARQGDVAEASSDVSTRQLDVELYKLRDRVQNLYFGVLLLTEQIAQTEMKISDLDALITSMEGAVRSGAVLASTVRTLTAERLTARQRLVQLKASRTTYRMMLARLTGMTIDTTMRLTMPMERVLVDTIRRPELSLFHAQERLIDVRNEAIDVRALPRFTAFFTGGYGRPGLDMLKNAFSPYYVTGIRMSWPLTDLYASSAERELLSIERSTIAVQRETFLFNTALLTDQQREEIRTYASLLDLDDAIITERTAVLAASRAQLTNGVRTAHDVVRDLNDLDIARRDRSLHAIQRLMAIHAYASTTGN
jgi:outer membrane protein TolC